MPAMARCKLPQALDYSCLHHGQAAPIGNLNVIATGRRSHSRPGGKGLKVAELAAAWVK
jgi:hypothetical protein